MAMAESERDIVKFLQSFGVSENVCQKFKDEDVDIDDIRDFTRDDVDHLMKGMSFKEKKSVWKVVESLNTKTTLGNAGSFFNEGLAVLNSNVSYTDMLSESFEIPDELLENINSSGPESELSKSDTQPRTPGRESCEVDSTGQQKTPTPSSSSAGTVLHKEISLPLYTEEILWKLDESNEDMRYDLLLSVVKDTANALKTAYGRKAMKEERKYACDKLARRFRCLGKKEAFGELVRKRLNNVFGYLTRKSKKVSSDQVSTVSQPKKKLKLLSEVSSSKKTGNEQTHEGAESMETKTVNSSLERSQTGDERQDKEQDAIDKNVNGDNANETMEKNARADKAGADSSREEENSVPVSMDDNDSDSSVNDELADERHFKLLRKNMENSKGKGSKTAIALMEETFKYRMDLYGEMPPQGRATKVKELMPIYGNGIELIKDMGRIIGEDGDSYLEKLSTTWEGLQTKLYDYGERNKKKLLDDKALTCLGVLAEELGTKKGNRAMVEFIEDSSMVENVQKQHPYLLVLVDGSSVKQAWVMADGEPFCKFENLGNFSVAMFSLIATHFVLHFSYVKSVDTAYRFLEYHLLNFGKEPKTCKYKTFAADVFSTKD